VFFVILVLLATLAAPALGWWLSTKEPKVWGPAMGATLAVTVAYPLLAQRADWMLALTPWRSLAWVDDIWWIPFAACFLSVAAARVDAERKLFKLPAIAVVGLVVLLGLFCTGWTLSGAVVTSREHVDAKGVTRQTTMYTCGAAAAATLVRSLGMERTEAEMARRTGVVPQRGTTFVKVYWALTELLAEEPYDVALTRAAEPTADMPMPCLAGVKLSPLLNHFIVVREIKNGRAILDDPLNGRVDHPVEHLKAQWLGVVIAVTPK